MCIIYWLYQPSHLPSLQWTGANPCYVCSIAKLEYRYICLSPQDWWRHDSDAPWKLAENRPGESPFKPEGNPFAIVPGGDSPKRIRPDVVHTFHIGFGVDMAASFVVWLCKLGKLGSTGRPRQAFDDKLSMAYSTFREYCHIHKRFTACDHWSMKKLAMTSKLSCAITWCIMFFFSPNPLRI